MQICSKLIEDHESISVVPGYESDLTESEYPEINQDYLDLMAVYMEELFFTKPIHIFRMSVVFQRYQDPCKQDQAGNFYKTLLLGLSLNMVKRN